MRHLESASSVAPTTGRLRLIISYDGGPYQGWQSQTNGDAIQDRLETAFAQLCDGERVVIHGSGRTDAGVHARGQVAHADVPGYQRHPLERWRSALNAHLPPQIRVDDVRLAPPGFHARYSASGKVYRYRVWNHAVLDPFERGRAWHFPNPLDLSVLRASAALLIGQHDFASFSANRGTPPETTVRTVHRITVRKQGKVITLDFAGNGFLYKMVRLITGSLIRCAQGRATTDWLASLLAGSAKTSFAAPPEGLYLLKVLYPLTQYLE